MKIIEALKLTKSLLVKAQDLRAKIKASCADLDYETPMYPNQKAQVDAWLQAHYDIVKEIGRLKFLIQKTNLLVQVPIELDGKHVTKSIAEWVVRRRELATLEAQAWGVLSDRGLKEGTVMQSTGVPKEVRIRRYYDPTQRDTKLAALQAEPSQIDSTLEIINATTDIVE